MMRAEREKEEVKKEEEEEGKERVKVERLEENDERGKVGNPLGHVQR